MAESSGYQRIAAYAVCREPTRILLCRLSDRTRRPGSWTLPGGGIDFGEAPADGVLRELTEETGLTGELVRLLDVWSEFTELEREGAPIPYHAIRVIYEVAITGGELRDEVDESTDAAAWFDHDALVDVELVPWVRELLVGLPRVGGVE